MNLFRVSPFFESQRRGRWGWPWLLLGILLGAITSLIAGAGFVFALMILGNLMDLPWVEAFLESQTYKTPQLLLLMLLMVGIFFWLAAIVGTLVQGRSIRSLVSPLRPFRWGLAGKSVFLISLLAIIVTAIPIPGISHDAPKLEFTGLRLEHALWLAPVLLCILLQTSGEDALFKGYLLRQLGAVTRISWIAPVVVVSVFTILHVGNEDMRDDLWVAVPFFVVAELLAIYLLMRSGGMEIPLVLHWINNVIVFIFVAEEATQSNDLTLWVWENSKNESISRANAIASLASYLIFAGLLLLAFCWRRSPFYVPPMAYQNGADQPATAPESKPESEENSESESEERS